MNESAGSGWSMDDYPDVGGARLNSWYPKKVCFEMLWLVFCLRPKSWMEVGTGMSLNSRFRFKSSTQLTQWLKCWLEKSVLDRRLAEELPTYDSRLVANRREILNSLKYIIIYAGGGWRFFTWKGIHFEVNVLHADIFLGGDASRAHINYTCPFSVPPR